MLINNVTQQWERCLEIIKDNLPAEQYDAWFAPIVPISYEHDVLTLKVPSQFYIEQIEERYLNLLSHTLKRAFGEKVQLAYKFNVVNNAPDSEVTLREDGLNTRLRNDMVINKPQVVNPFARVEYADIDPQLNPRYSFENYCGSMSNKLAVSIGMAIAANPDCKTYNPMFIFGSTGVGKTHLIQAIGIRIKENNPRARVL